MKRGNAGDESVWWSNTRHMLKAYIKHLEMIAHGASDDEWAVQWCKREGVVRVEAEMKKRLLSDEGLQDWGEISDDRLVKLFEDQTSILRAVDRSDEPDLLASIPARSRMYAAAWLAGQDLKGMLSNGTLYRHAKVLREYGLDILQARNVTKMPIKVQVVELKPLAVPEWYSLERPEPALRLVA